MKIISLMENFAAGPAPFFEDDDNASPADGGLDVEAARL